MALRRHFKDLFIILLWCFISTTEAQQPGCTLLNATQGANVYPSGIIVIASIREDLEVGTVITNFTLGKSNNVVTLTETPHPYFELITNNSIRLKSPLDAELNVNLQPLILTCTDGQESYTINIEFPPITDVNEYVPTFIDPPYAVNVSEGAPIGTIVFTFNDKSEDKDKNNMWIGYYINETHFKIETPKQGSVEITQKLDYEIQRRIVMTVTAKDNPSSLTDKKFSSQTTLTINVMDENDQNPKFIGNSYTATLLENTTVGSTVNVQPPILAEDQDLGINAPVKYLIEPGNDAEYFTINETSGVVKLNKTGIRRGQTLTVAIMAQEVDDESRTDKVILTVIVTAVNKDAPLFEYPTYTKSVMENMLVGSEVLKVTATDKDLHIPVIVGAIGTQASDEGANLQYSIMDATDTFEINDREGSIKLIKRLDFETRKTFEFTIKVSDGKYFDTATVTINVLDINDNNPVFEQNEYLFELGRIKDTVVGKVVATDPDLNPESQIKYTLKKYTGLFAVDEITGEIRVTADPKNLTLNSYFLLIEASDRGLPPRTSATLAVVTFPALVSITQPTRDNLTDNMYQVYILAGVAGFLLVICIILAILSIKLVKRRREQEARKPKVRPNPEGLSYSQPPLNGNNITNITEFMDGNSTPTQHNPLAMDNHGYIYDDDDENMRQEVEIEIDPTMEEDSPNGHVTNLGSKGSPTSTNSSTASLIGALKKEGSQKKKKSLSWGRNHEEVFNAEAPIDPDASVLPVEDIDDEDDGKPKITLYF